MHRKSILDYKCIEKLGESPHAVIYKGFHKENPHKALIIKVLKLGHLSQHQKIHFRQKIEQLKVLNGPLLARPLGFEDREDKQFIRKNGADQIFYLSGGNFLGKYPVNRGDETGGIRLATAP